MEQASNTNNTHENTEKLSDLFQQAADILTRCMNVIYVPNKFGCTDEESETSEINHEGILELIPVHYESNGVFQWEIEKNIINGMIIQANELHMKREKEKRKCLKLKNEENNQNESSSSSTKNKSKLLPLKRLRKMSTTRKLFSLF